MIHVTFRFYAELNDFLPAGRRQVAFDHALPEPGSVKDAIEALGVAHTELDPILANGETVDFGFRLADGDRIAAYPVFEALIEAVRHDSLGGDHPLVEERADGRLDADDGVKLQRMGQDVGVLAENAAPGDLLLEVPGAAVIDVVPP